MLIRLLLLLALIPCQVIAGANLPNESLIRDAEIEDVLESYTTPLFKAAGLNPESMHLFIINSKEVNAFAMGGGQIAIHTGLILRANSALQVIGVLAHETAHVAGNHILRGIDAYKDALFQQLLSTIGGLAIGLAGSPEAATAILLGSQDMIEKGLLKFSRSQEGAADQGAARFLDSLGYSSRGLLEFMEILKKDDFMVEHNVDPYTMTHPLKAERIDFFKSHLEKSPHAQANLSDEFETNFKRIQIKISAFIEKPEKTLRQFPPSDTTLFGRYARAIAYFQNSQVQEALGEVNSLLKDNPRDAFFWDLKGQILFDSGKIKEAVNAYNEAVHLRPDIPLLRVSLAHALLESGDKSLLERALSELLRAKTEEGDHPFTYRLLAVYYGKTGQTGLAALSLAEMALQFGDFKMAEQQAKRSKHLLKGDPINYARAKDIEQEIKRQKESNPYSI